MTSIPKKVVERYKKSVPKFQQVLEVAKKRDINEADTVLIIQDMLSDVFGFEKYLEITSEYSIRGSYCDLAIKLDGKIMYLIEVKAIGISLKEGHLRQAIDYGANLGVNWVVLTNGLIWKLYKIKFEKPIDYEFVVSLDFSELNIRKSEDQEKLFLLSKKGVARAALDDFYARAQNINRFIIGALIISEPIINIIRRDLRKISPGIKIDGSEIDKIIRSEVLKRDVIEGDEATKASNRLKRLLTTKIKSRRSRKLAKNDTSETSEASFSDKRLNDNQ